MLVRVCCCDRGASHDLINSIYSIYLGEISRHGAGGGGASAAAVEAYSSVISKLQAFVRSSQNNSILCGMTAGNFLGNFLKCSKLISGSPSVFEGWSSRLAVCPKSKATGQWPGRWPD